MESNGSNSNILEIYKVIATDCENMLKGTPAAFVEGSPGCGKSFVMIWWILRNLNTYVNAVALVLVPYRRLATQFGELFMIIAGGSLTMNMLFDYKLTVVEGMNPDLSKARKSRIVVCTYEHSWTLISSIPVAFTVVDEVHNLFYPHRGWQLEPFLCNDNVLCLTGTVTKEDESVIIRKMCSNQSRPCTIWRMNANHSFGRVESIVTRMCDAAFLQRALHSNYTSGGVFYFCSQISNAVLKAYEFSATAQIPILNPLSDNEIQYLRSNKKIKKLSTKIKILKRCPLLNIGSIPTPCIYIDYSSHFDEAVRTAISTQTNCMFIVFCTTTLCEGLNIKSMKTLIVEGGRWDRRRLMQIEGRASRFGVQQRVFIGKIAPFITDINDLHFDLFDYVKVLLRDSNTIYELYKEPLVEPYILEMVRRRVVPWLRANQYSSIEAYLNSNFGISINIRYSDFQKAVLNKMNPDKLLGFISIVPTHYKEVYDSIFSPILGLQFNQLVELYKDDED